MYLPDKVKIIALCALTFVSVNVSAQEHEIGQKEKTFVMDGKKVEKLSIHVGDKINFKNYDPWFHNIFSLSDTKTFDLGSYPQGEFRTVTFTKAGEVEIECAIHPQMYMVLKVDDSLAANK